MTVLERHARAEEAKMLARDVCEAATATLKACGEVRDGSRDCVAQRRRELD